MGRIKDFKELNIWTKGVELAKMVYQMTGAFPSLEIYGLTSQIRRSSISIPSNIAEGYRRYSKKEFKRFINIALGSLAELETQIIISAELKYIDKKCKDGLLKFVGHLNGMMLSFVKKL